jgi:hypothetical protein
VAICAAALIDEQGRERIAFAWVDAKIDGGQPAIKARVLSDALT